MITHFDRPKSFGEKIGLGLAQAGQAAGQLIPEYMEKEERRTKERQGLQELQKLTGVDFTGVPVDLQKEYLKSFMSQKEQAQKLAGEYGYDQENYEKIKNTFGEKFADVWKASPTGARTSLTQSALDARARGIDLDEILTGVDPLKQGQKREPKELKKGDVPEYQLDTSGMNRPEQFKYKSELRKENTPLWKENINNYKSLKTMTRDIKSLTNLNENKNLPEGMEKFLINPETGNFYTAVTALHDVHPDVQLWVKILARQATQAQTAFPGRVTNFDLQSFMLQFPSLFNTYDGRKNILKMIELDTKAKELHSKALDNVYNKYKADGITPEDAYRLASEMVQNEIQAIDDELVSLSSQSQQEAGSKNKMIDVIGPDGQEYEIDELEINELPEGFRIK